MKLKNITLNKNKMKIRKTSGKNHKIMIEGLLGILDGLIKFVTLGFYSSDLQWSYMKNYIFNSK